MTRKVVPGLEGVSSVKVKPNGSEPMGFTETSDAATVVPPRFERMKLENCLSPIVQPPFVPRLARVVVLQVFARNMEGSKSKRPKNPSDTYSFDFKKSPSERIEPCFLASKLLANFSRLRTRNLPT